MKRTIVVEHLDTELEEWQILEYKTIWQECERDGFDFILCGLADPPNIGEVTGIPLQCLRTEFLADKTCLLDPKGEQDLSPEDGQKFDVFLFGGILGDDPPRDRTAELRAKGFPGRRLGREQMTTDTAARVTRMVIQGKHLDEITYIDRPDIELPATDGPKESVSMPFKYVKNDKGPIMPDGMVSLLAADMDKGIDGLL
ncbi:DUF431-domain-containing protein, partial [Piedraia hortae CBS 480.64]